MKIYISGPMRGIPGFNFPAFDEADRILQELGHTTFNPAARDRFHGFDLSAMTGHEALASIGFNSRRAFSEDMRWIAEEADAVVLLEGWEQSLGARAEAALAAALGLPCWTLRVFLSRLVEAPC